MKRYVTGRGNAPGQKPKLEKEHYKDIRTFMQSKGWLLLKITGSIYQVGYPDVYATHKEHGPRWIETKRPESGKLSSEQIEVFTALTAHGAGVWIMETVEDYPNLFGRANWWRWCVKDFKL